MKTIYKSLRTLIIIALAAAALWLLYVGGAWLVRMILQMHGISG